MIAGKITGIATNAAIFINMMSKQPDMNRNMKRQCTFPDTIFQSAKEESLGIIF